jgi:hypothetical protein
LTDWLLTIARMMAAKAAMSAIRAILPISA